MAHGRPNALHLVRADPRADARPAHHEAALHLARSDGSCDLTCDIRKVDWGGIEAADVEYLMPALFQKGNSATLSGAKALGRDDLGRIAAGAKADLLFWEGASLFMTPMRDPVRNIVYSAQAEDLNATMVDGNFIMKDRIVAGFDIKSLMADLQAGAEYMWANMHRQDWAHRDINTLSPESFPEFRR
jgi:hypothetical protein